MASGAVIIFVGNAETSEKRFFAARTFTDNSGNAFAESADDIVLFKNEDCISCLGSALYKLYVQRFYSVKIYYFGAYAFRFKNISGGNAFIYDRARGEYCYLIARFDN